MASGHSPGEKERGREAKKPGQREERELVARSTSGQRKLVTRATSGQREERELVARSTERELAEFRLYLLERLMEEAIVKVLKVCTSFIASLISAIY